MSKKDMSDIEKAICQATQLDISLTTRPFKKLAEDIGISEDLFIEKVQEFLDKGYIRRFGAALRHRKAGIAANGMGVWKVPEGDREQTGNIMSSFTEVTHCYERPSFPGWDYNLFTMIHAKTKEECHATAARIAEATGITEYKLLFSSREFKKVSMVYF